MGNLQRVNDNVKLNLMIKPYYHFPEPHASRVPLAACPPVYSRSQADLRTGKFYPFCPQIFNAPPLSMALTVLILLSFTGCTYSGGEFLYMMGLGQGRMKEAKFTLTEGPVMIFVDDYHERMDWPQTARYLFNDLAQDMLKNEAAKKIIPLKTIAQLRQSMPDFEKKSCREIGELAGAEQVIWIEVRDFLAEEQVYDANNAAYLRVSVRVVNALEKKKRMRVRLWPTSPDGYTLTVVMSGSEVAIAKSKNEISKHLAYLMSVEVAKLFYDHRAGDFDREP